MLNPVTPVFFPILDDGSIRKCLITEGSGEYPRFGQRVCISCAMAVTTPFYECESLEFILGEELIPGLSTSVASMQVGERSRFEIDPQWAYGDATLENVPPNSTIRVEVLLKSIFHEFRDCDEAQRAAEIHMNDASELFRAGKYEEAIQKYKVSLEGFAPFYGKKVDEITTRIYRNLSVAYGKLNQWKKSIHCADRVLQKEPNDIRAIARKSEGLLQIGDLDKAEEMISTGLKNSHNNQIFVQFKKRLTDMKKQDAIRQAQLMKKMMK